MSKEVNYQINYKIDNLEEEDLKMKVLSAPSVYDAKELFYELTPEFKKEKSRIFSITSHILSLEDDFEFPDPPPQKELTYIHSRMLLDNGWKWFSGNIYEKLFKNTQLRIIATPSSVKIYETFSPGASNDKTMFFGRNLKTIEDLNFILDKIGVEEIS